MVWKEVHWTSGAGRNAWLTLQHPPSGRCFMQSKHILENFSTVFSQKRRGFLKVYMCGWRYKITGWIPWLTDQRKSHSMTLLQMLKLPLRLRFASMTNGFESPIWDTSESSDILGAFTSVLGHYRDLYHRNNLFCIMLWQKEQPLVGLTIPLSQVPIHKWLSQSKSTSWISKSLGESCCLLSLLMSLISHLGVLCSWLFSFEITFSLKNNCLCSYTLKWD